MTDNRTQVNNRPFVPGASGSSASRDWGKADNATSTPSTNHITSDEYEKLVKAADSGDEASKKRLEQINAKYNAQYNGVVNETVMSILEGDGYLDNALNASYNPTYHFRLFMTSEHELITDAKRASHDDLLKALDNLPQVTIAESGVTAGFNIQSVEMDQAVGPGWRTRSSMMSGLTINIVEPMGSSLVEDIVIAGSNLGVSNYAKFWYFLELSFLGYADDGSPQLSLLGDMNLSNGGRWVYQIAITNIRVNTDETGSRYELECIPYSQATAFDPDSVGSVCDNLNVSGGTIKEFCDNLATAMEKAWEERYVGKIYTFKIVNRPIIGPKGEQIDVGAIPLNQSEKDPQHHVSFGKGSGGAPEALIPKGSSVADVLTFLYAHAEGMQKIMLDTESTEVLDDGDEDTVSWNGKKYRVAMIPYIEPDVRVTGYDPITGNYMKEITFNIWGYRNYAANISPNQYKVVTEKPQIAADIAAELKKNNYLQKRYYYLFTGKNTEVINFDISYNFAFSAVLPSLSGWRKGVSSVSDHEKYNEDVRKEGGAQASQKNEVTISPEKLNQKLTEVNEEYENEVANLNDKKQYGGTADEIQKIEQRISQLRDKRKALTKSAALIRSRYATQSKIVREKVEREGLKYTYAEDADANALPFTITYRQGAYETEEASGFGFFDQWHRGSSLTGALLNQTYTPVTDAMISISVNVRGDPYWLGYSNLERRSIAQNPASQPRPDGRPNFTEGDSTFALILRFPKEIGDDGQLVFRNSDVFNGVYRVTNVKHSFKDGQFTQTLEAFKLELITVTQSEASRNNNNG